MEVTARRRIGRAGQITLEQDALAMVLDLRIGDGLVSDVFLAVPDEGFHASISSACGGRRMAA